MNTTIEIKDRLEKSGIKASFQRMAILDYLVNNPIHPTVDTIFSSLHSAIPTLSKTTVYNTLKLLEDHGVIRSLLIDEKNVRYDADLSSHAHFKCKKCGSVMDIYLDPFVSEKIEKQHGLTIINTEVYFQGYCKECTKDIN